MSALTHPAPLPPRRLRPGAARGSALGVAPALLTLGSGESTAEYYAHVAAHPDAHAWAGLLGVVSFPLLLVGILGIVHLIRARGITLAHLGAVLAVVGRASFPALAGSELLDAVGVQAVGQEQMVAIAEEGFEQSGFAIALLLLVLVPGLLSALLIGLAVGRAGLAPWWAAGTIVVGTVLLMAPGDLFVAGNVLHLVGFGAVGVRMLRLDDRAWDAPPADWRSVGREAVAAARASEREHAPVTG